MLEKTFKYGDYTISKSYFELNDKEIETLEMGIIVVKEMRTLRCIASFFDVSFSTVHRRIHKICKELSPELYKLVCKQLKENHVRGMHW